WVTETRHRSHSVRRERHVRCPLWVIRVRVRPAAAPAMSVMLRKRRSATKMRSVAMGQKQTHATAAKIDRLGQMLTNFRQQLARAVGLRHIVITTGHLRDLLLSVERIGGDRDDRDRSQRGVSF